MLPSEQSETKLVCPTCSRRITYEEVSIISSPCIIGNPIPSSYCYKCFSCRKGYGGIYNWDSSLFPEYPDHKKCPCKDIYDDYSSEDD